MKLITSLTACFVLMLTSLCLSANSVLIQSDTVPVSANEVQIGIYIENDDALSAVILPIKIRAVTAGSYIADTLIVTATNRFTTHLVGFTVKGFLPEEDNTNYWQCSGTGFRARGYPNFSSPDAFLYAALSGDEDSCLSVGNDGSPPGGTPSLTLSFGVTSVLGSFELDTTCITPGNHLLFMDCDVPANTIIPTFTKGVIEIACACDCHTDPNCDTYHDIVDWLLIRNVAQGSIGPIPDPNGACPMHTTDVNCDGVTNNTDKNLMYEVVFNAGDPDTLFCDPCP